MKRRWVEITILVLALSAALFTRAGDDKVKDAESTTKEAPATLVKSEEEWRKTLSPEQYRVLRKSGTERAFTGKYWDHKGEGTYHCAGCENPLFLSKTKFKSGTGWPSYYEPVDSNHVKEKTDVAYGMVRTEVLCAACGGHLGHVFNDGPKPTGLRYCINSAALEFKEQTVEVKSDP